MFNEKSEDLSPDVILKEYVPGSAFVKEIFAIPLALASSTPPRCCSN